ncbi:MULTISPECIES: LCP family protein [Bacillaceae]|uniref:LCP family protein n=1 Tax=Evansella alkalicola TaxID=745819 RepID=A0ABS6JT59_9BACI|nr:MULTISPECIES: LCP family protein [Bacillaceae]MBU9721746.1 LCP family protein [Bacillus alkalicola]
MAQKLSVDKPKKRKIHRVFLYAGLTIAMFALVYGGYVGAKVYQTLNDIQDDDFNNEKELDEVDNFISNYDSNEHSIEEAKVEMEQMVRNGDTISIMIAGVDNEHGRISGRSDVLMVAVIDLETQESTLLSIPRDTYVEIAGTGEYDKINHAYANGVDTAVKTLENFLDIPIDHYIAVNFTGFEQFIDFLGGIELDVERTIYHNLHPERVYLYPGIQTVNGSNALEYVRFRADNEGDFGRNRRQQQVVKEVLNQSTSLRSVTRIPDILDILGNNVRTSMDTGTMFSMVRNLNSLTGDNVETLRLVGEGMVLNGVYYVDVSDEDHSEVVEALQERMQIEYETVLVNSDEESKSVEKALEDY